MSGYETIMAELLARLTTPTDFMGTGGRGTRRAHLTSVPREDAPACNIMEGDDRRTGTCSRECMPAVSIIVRNDDGAVIADAYIGELYTRLSAAWPKGVTLEPPSVHRIVEIADKDVVRIDVPLKFCYETAGKWSLDLPT